MNQYPKVFKNKFGKVTIYRTVTKQKWVSFRVLWRRGKQIFEERFSDESVAEARANEVLNQLSVGDEILSRVDKEKIAYYVTCEQMLGGRISLMELVRRYTREEERIEASASLKECVEKYLKSMESRGLSTAHMGPVRSRLTKFMGVMPDNLFDITVDMANEYLNKIENLTTRFNERVVLNRIFTWCKAQGILPADRPHIIARTDVPKAKWKEPEIITPEHLAKVLWVAKTSYPETVVPIVLGAFAGLRRAEITRLKVSDINMEHGHIMVSAEITKTNQRRVITISDTLRAWLEDYLLPTQSFTDPSYKYKVHRCVEYTKAAWPTNGLRHSYVSYRVQHDKDPNAVAHECGHSIEILLRHYKCLCTPEAAEAWFDILPETTNFGMESSGVEREIPIDS